MEKRLILIVNRFFKDRSIFIIEVEHLCYSEEEIVDTVNKEIEMWTDSCTKNIEYQIARVITVYYDNEEEKSEDITDSALYNYKPYMKRKANIEKLMKKYNKK